MKISNLLKLIVALLFLIVNINAQVVTNTAVLYSSITQADNTIVSVPIPIEVVRTDGKVAELRLNIGNVSASAKLLNLRVYELIYTTNVVETPLVTSQPTNPPVVVTPPVTPPVVTPPVVTPPVVTPPVVVNPPPVVTNTPTTITNDVTLSVTIKNTDDSERNVNLPAKTIWTDNKLENIIFDISSLPASAIIIRYRILD